MPEILNLPLTLGRKDSVDPKFAPLGVVAVAKNLRVRADGRLTCRNGYVRQPMTTSSGTLVAYDLHEFQGRLLALGSDTGDVQPADIFEQQSGSAAFPWRSTDVNKNQALCPFTNPRELAGICQLGNGAVVVGAAAGAGLVCSIWQPAENTDLYAQVVRQSDGQVMVHQKLVTNVATAQVCFSVDTFYVQIAQANSDVTIQQCAPATASTFTAFATHVIGGTVSTGHDIVPVMNGSTGRVVSAVSKAGTNSTTIKVYNSAGAQVGSTATVTQTAIFVQVEGDQVDNTINLYSVTTPSVGQIRTFNFTTGALTLGPTATTVGVSGGMCRLPVLGANVQAVAVAVNDANSDVTIQTFNQATHASVSTWKIQRALIRSRLVNGQSGTQKRAVVFAALLAPSLPVLKDPVSGSTTVTNALVYTSVTAAHVSTRDLLNGVDPCSGVVNYYPNLSLDSSTGRLCWCCAKGTTIGVGGSTLIQPAVTIVDFLSSARRQSAQYGALLYLTGATVAAYDGTIPTELGFNEVPGVYTVTPAAGGTLIASASYSYVHHWEYTRADGSIERSAPSTVIPGNTGVGQTQNTLVVSTPHSVRVALGATLFGGSVVSVLSRTVWDTVTGTQGSLFRRCVVTQIPSGMANFGAKLSVTDGVSDASLSTQGVVYTQGQKGDLSGPVENDAPEGCSFMSCSSARVLTAGLVRPFEFLESREAFLDEPENFTQLSVYYGKVSKPVLGVVSLDGVRFVFSRDEIYAVQGVGPDDIGAGRLPPAIKVKSPSGLKDWRSLLECHTGVYFQLADSQLYEIQGGTPVWAGVDIQGTLASFPVITGAGLVRADDAAVFACSNSAGTDSRLVVRSLRTGIWSEDTPPLVGAAGITALRSVGDYFSYISGGVVFAETAGLFVDDSSTVIPTQLRTYPIYPFTTGGYGQCRDILLTCEALSAGTLAMRVSLDDGQTFDASYDTFTIAGAATKIQKRWALQQVDCNSVIFEWTFTPSAPGGGLIIQQATLLANAERGKLIELDPQDNA